jgi:pyruvate,water dikinase
LDQPEDVFGLTIEELDQALFDPSLDLRSRIAFNNHYWKRYGHVREFPTVFDSRGRILRAPRKPTREGEIQGEPISAGIVTGRVKILHQPDEKPLLPGEILVTRATDPGWTPLFINAGGIILEVGGLLQHGALVAREYGKPCVAGIENACAVFKEGQQVELNGSNGMVRILTEPSLS